MLTSREIAEKCGLFYPEKKKKKDGTSEVIIECCVEPVYRNALNKADMCCTSACPFWKPNGATEKIRKTSRSGRVWFEKVTDDMRDKFMTPKEYSNWFYGRGGAE